MTRAGADGTADVVADDLPELLLPDAAAWRAWLAEHHAQPTGVWLVLHRNGGDVTALTYTDAVDEALKKLKSRYPDCDIDMSRRTQPIR